MSKENEFEERKRREKAERRAKLLGALIRGEKGKK